MNWVRWERQSLRPHQAMPSFPRAQQHRGGWRERDRSRELCPAAALLRDPINNWSDLANSPRQRLPARPCSTSCSGLGCSTAGVRGAGGPCLLPPQPRLPPFFPALCGGTAPGECAALGTREKSQ